MLIRGCTCAQNAAKHFFAYLEIEFKGINHLDPGNITAVSIRLPHLAKQGILGRFRGTYVKGGRARDDGMDARAKAWPAHSES